MNNELIYRLVYDLCNEPYFSAFKIRKSDSSLIFKTPDIHQRIYLENGSIHGLPDHTIVPKYQIRFNIVHKWWERHCFWDIKNQRNAFTFRFDNEDFGFAKKLQFKIDSYNYAQVSPLLCAEIAKYTEYIFSNYGSMSKCYENKIVPILENKNQIPMVSVDTLFLYLALCRIVASDNYQTLKEVIIERINKLYKAGEAHTVNYYDRIPEIFADLESYDFEHPEKATPYFTLHQSPKKAKKVSLLSNKEKETRSKNARRIVAKKYGFQQCDYCNWKLTNGYFFVIYDLMVIQLCVKPLYVDDLYWEIFDTPDLKDSPMSFRSIGAFVVPDECLHTYKAPFTGDSTDSDYTEENAIKQWDNIFRQISDDVNRFLKENSDVEAFDIKKRERGGQIPRLMMLCHHERYNEALQLIEEETKACRGSSVGFSMPDGSNKDAYDFIREYCEKQLKLQNKDKNHKLLHFLFRRNK